MSPAPAGASTEARASRPAVVAVDTGGTFTDLLLLREGRLRTLKVPSTPHDPAEAVLSGIRELLGEPPPAFVLLHGSTVATNALLERTGARVTLVTNAGFEDVIEIGRQDRPQLYALVGHRPPPLVARRDRLGVAGRMGPRGEEVEPLDRDELAGLAERVAGAEALAVVLLHSYADPSHERAVADALAGAGVPVSVSSDLLPEYREYERTSTTVVNAYVAPVMSRYLGRLAREAGAERTSVMGSNGGTLPVERAAREAAHTVLSGPAGGVVGALAWARRAGLENVITFDMGGTSTDVSLCPGRPLHTRELQIDGQPVALPVIDIHTVGAGGGSLARVDTGGALRVGPQSAGATPGPIAYGRGGTGVTVTDAHVWLGRLPRDAFLGGERHLDRAAVEAPLRALADALGTGLEAAAEGILAVADTAMERALRVISVERGYDPAEFVRVAVGGAGALHVAGLTARLGASRALVPPTPGLLSAYGILTAPVTREASRTVLLATAEADAEERVERALDALEKGAATLLEEEGVSPADVDVERWVDARYRGQSYELRVAADGWVARFHRAHAERYGYAREEAPVEAVTTRAVATAPGPPLEAFPLEDAEGAPGGAPHRIHFRGEDIDALRVWRQDLRAGHVLSGPALVLEYSATTWLPPGWTLEVDRWGVMHLLPGEG
ncbi:MAG: hydantoinase/oxoprolinase family protein [Gemmatimonadetes bacterium]|nr:hydantoinase/oxoprolinase family protein [Gemmatimonadota bacterium]